MDLEHNLETENSLDQMNKNMLDQMNRKYFISDEQKIFQIR